VASDLSAAAAPATLYMQYNWHGDAVTVMALDGAGGSNYTPYDPWGNPPQATPTRWNYYRWNGAWGYLYFEDLGLYYAHGRWYNSDTGMWLSPSETGEYRYGSGQDAVNWVWFSWGFNCQFYNDITLGLYEYQQPLSVFKCRDFDGTEFFVGRWVGRLTSDVLAFLESSIGGITFIGGGGVTILSGGTVAPVSIPVAAGGAALTSHGVTVLVRNTVSPITLAKKSGNSSDPPSSTTYRERFYQKYPNAPRDYRIHHRLRQKAHEMNKFPSEVVDSVENLRAVPDQVHRQINSEWANFWRRNLNPTSKQISDFAKYIDEIYGWHFWQP